jgi:hypothetical protein
MTRSCPTVLAAFALLTCAATAYAECAWGVWHLTSWDNPAVSRIGNWIPRGHSRKRGECRAEMDVGCRYVGPESTVTVNS